MERLVRLVGFAAASGLASLALAAVPERHWTWGQLDHPPGSGDLLDRGMRPAAAYARTGDLVALQAQLDATMALAHRLLDELNSVQRGLDSASEGIEVLRAEAMADVRVGPPTSGRAAVSLTGPPRLVLRFSADSEGAVGVSRR